MTGAPDGGPRRIAADDPGGLGSLVVAVLDLLRDLLERQAVRRVEAGSLTGDEVERLGMALQELQARIDDLRDTLTR